MSRDIKMHYTSMMDEDDKDEQNLEPDGVYREEVNRSEFQYVVGEKCFLRLEWWL